MKGIILAGGNGTRLHPLTLGVSKQMLPVYDKPLIYYPLSTLMLAGIREIVIVSKTRDIEGFGKILGDGERFGCEFSFVAQDEANGIAEAYILAEHVTGKDSTALILGDNVFVGAGLGSALQNDNKLTGAIIYATQVSNPQEFGVVELNNQDIVVSLVEKPSNPKSNLAVTGFYLTDSSVYERVKEVNPSKRGELEILSVMTSYLKSDELAVRQLERGTAWFDTGNPNSLFEASEYIKLIQSRQNRLISSPEEIAWRNNWINDTELIEIANKFTAGAYQAKLKALVQ